MVLSYHLGLRTESDGGRMAAAWRSIDWMVGLQDMQTRFGPCGLTQCNACDVQASFSFLDSAFYT